MRRATRWMHVFDHVRASLNVVEVSSVSAPPARAAAWRVWRAAPSSRPPLARAQAVQVLMHASEPAVATVLSSTQTTLLMPPSVWQPINLVLGFLTSRSHTSSVESMPAEASTPGES